MPYRVQIESAAQKQIAKLERRAQAQVVAKIESLKLDPRPHGVKKLSGEDGLYRVRTGNYRIVYAIYDAQLLVIVVKVGDRKDVYD
jgi:mRNA interferase RelE/StbE